MFISFIILSLYGTDPAQLGSRMGEGILICREERSGKDLNNNTV